MNQQRQKQRTPWQWYRSRTRKRKLSLIGGAFTAVLLFGLWVNVAMGRGSSSTRHANVAVHTAIPSPTAALELTPIPEQKSSPTPAAKPTTSTTPSQAAGGSATVYYGVHVALLDMSLVNAFEADAHKPVAIVMWYQQWGLTNGYQSFQPSWMDAVRAHGSIPLVTWDPTQSPQPAYALR